MNFCDEMKMKKVSEISGFYMCIRKKMMKLMSGEDEDDKFWVFFPESVTFLTEIDGRTNVANGCQSQGSFL